MKNSTINHSILKRLICLITFVTLLIFFFNTSYGQWDDQFTEGFETPFSVTSQISAGGVLDLADVPNWNGSTSFLWDDGGCNVWWNKTPDYDSDAATEDPRTGDFCLVVSDVDDGAPIILEHNISYDFASMTDVRLYFYYQIYDLDAGEYAKFEVWDGDSWEEVWTSPEDTYYNTYQEVSVNCNAHINANFKVRLLCEMSSGSDLFCLDDFKIQTQGGGPCSGAAKLLFYVSKPPSEVTKDVGFTVKVKAVDNSDILCTDNTSTITLALNSGNGTLSSATGLNQTLVAGVYEWTDVKYNANETFTIKATDDASVLTQATSNDILCTYWTTVVDGAVSDNDHVFDETNEYSFTEYIYLQSVINTASGYSGIINAIQLEHAGAGCTTNPVQIYIGHTDSTAYDAVNAQSDSDYDWIIKDKSGDDLILVYNGSITTTDGWYTVILERPFYYNHSDNMVILFDNDAGSSCGSNEHYFAVQSYVSCITHVDNLDNYEMPSVSNEAASRTLLELASLKLNIYDPGCTPVSVTDDPDDAAGCTTGTVNFSVSASPAPTSYQWQEYTGSWSNLSDAGVYSNTSTATMTITNPTAGMDEYLYRCIVSNNCVIDDTSDAAVLYVDDGTPTAAVISEPSNGASNISLNQNLFWTNGGGATSYDIRFETSSPPAVVESDQIETEYNPGMMNTSTLYYWRIDSRNSCGTTNGTVWSFTTSAGDYFVNDGTMDGDEVWCTAVGNDANNGTSPSTPKLTITDVINDYALSPGDIILVDVGTYLVTDEIDEEIAITTADDGTSGNPVIFQGADSSKTILNCDNNASNSFVISGSYIIIDGFTIEKSDNDAIVLDPCGSSADVEYIEIRNCLIKNSGDDGIYFKGCGLGAAPPCYTCNYNKIHHNQIQCDGAGISINGSWGAFCQVAGAEHWSAYNKVYNNIIQSGNDGIECSYGIDHTSFYNNEIEASGSNAAAFDLTGGGYHDMRYTKIYNNFICGSDYGITTSGGDCKNSVIYFNTFHTNERCVYWEFAADAHIGDYVKIKNNIFYSTGGSTQDCFFVYDLAGMADADEGIEIDYNMYYKSLSNSDYAEYMTTNVYDLSELSDWRTDYGFDINSTWGTDPQLIGMHLSSSSPCISAGTPIAGYTSDFDGDSRPDGSKGAVNPDIGGDEYTAAGHPPCICDEMFLPIELLFFTAVCKDEEVQLNWATASETNNDFFTLERSNDAKYFEVVTTVLGAGNSNTVLHYDITDKCPYKETTYYRLKQTDYNGAYEYFDMVAVNCKEISDNGLEFIYVAQNQNRDGITVLFNSNEETEFGLYLFDILGHKIISKNGKSDYGLNSVSINTGNLSCGIYLVVLQNEDKTVTKKIMIN